MEFWVIDFAILFQDFIEPLTFASIISDEKGAIIFSAISLYIMCLFFFQASFLRLSHYCYFLEIWISCTLAWLSSFYPGWVFELLESVNWFHLFGENLDCYFQISFSWLIFFLLFFCYFNDTFWYYSTDSIHLFFCFSFFFFFWWDNLYWFCWLTSLSSVISILLSCPSNQ